MARAPSPAFPRIWKIPPKNEEGGESRPRLAQFRKTNYIILTLETCISSFDMVPVTVT